MIFETYDPTKHTLEVGTKIRLAGREGIITEKDDSRYYVVAWANGHPEHIDLKAFSLLEIAVSPLTIDKRVKGEILCMMSDQGTALDKFITIEDYLNSLEET